MVISDYMPIFFFRGKQKNGNCSCKCRDIRPWPLARSAVQTALPPKMSRAMPFLAVVIRGHHCFFPHTKWLKKNLQLSWHCHFQNMFFFTHNWVRGRMRWCMCPITNGKKLPDKSQEWQAKQVIYLQAWCKDSETILRSRFYMIDRVCLCLCRWSKSPAEVPGTNISWSAVFLFSEWKWRSSQMSVRMTERNPKTNTHTHTHTHTQETLSNVLRSRLGSMCRSDGKLRMTWHYEKIKLHELLRREREPMARYLFLLNSCFGYFLFVLICLSCKIHCMGN